MLNWSKQYDDNSNTEWIAQSCVGDEFGDCYYWKLSQKLENDRILWYENHDEDISDEYPCDFLELEEAKQYVKEKDLEIVEFRKNG
jgi:hypothetical protein